MHFSGGGTHLDSVAPRLSRSFVFACCLLRFSFENNNNSWFTDEMIRRQLRSRAFPAHDGACPIRPADRHRQVVEVILSAAAAAAAPASPSRIVVAQSSLRGVPVAPRRPELDFRGGDDDDGRANKIDPQAANLQRGRQRQRLCRRRRRL